MITRFLVGLLSALCLAGPVSAQPVNTGHLTAELVSEAQGIAPGQTIYVALRQQIQPHWHTYWRNAGDSGEATRIKWTLPSGWTAGDFIWPTPHRLPVGPLVNYGYEGEVLLPMALTAPASARPGQSVTLSAAAAFLVCYEICVPEDAVLTLSLPVTATAAPANAQWAPMIAAALASAPKPAGLVGVFEKTDGGLKLAITGAAVTGAGLAGAYFFPFASTVIDHARPQMIERGPQGLTLTLTPGYDFQGPSPPKGLAGVLVFGGKAYEVSANAGPLPAGAAGLGLPVARAPPIAAPGGLGLISAALFALAGGLILNLMPCVFPVLAMKAASLAGHGGGDHAEARRQGLAFGAGAVLTFLALAGLLIALRAAGAGLGWGFQLQDPAVVALLALLMLAIGLNLSGVFEIGSPLQGVGSGLAARGGMAGAFFTGVLAVVVAAPCTAPFMGSALGWALTQPPVAALSVFAALGIGFAAPFVAVAFAPALLNRLPRPGPWMETFKNLLAFPMYATAGWLVWVLTLQAGADALARVLAAGVALGLAAWLGGLAQRRMSLGARAVPQVILTTLLLGLALFAAVGRPYGEAAATSGTASTSGAASLTSEPYSPERLAELRAEGRPVFVNYTAAWCVSCQVNDRVALSTRAVAAAMRTNNVAYLKADWTKRDPLIAAELARFGRAGVPLYLVYGVGGGEPAILPALLTEGVVVRGLNAAGKAG